MRRAKLRLEMLDPHPTKTKHAVCRWGYIQHVFATQTMVALNFTRGEFLNRTTDGRFPGLCLWETMSMIDECRIGVDCKTSSEVCKRGGFH